MRVILGGGGGREQSLGIDRLFTTFLDDKPLAYIPVAMDPTHRSYAECLQWFRSVFTPLGRTDIDMWTDLRKRTPAEFAKHSGIYVGGGNTYLLMRQLHTSGIIPALVDAITHGQPYYGGSAGAVALGKSLRISNDAPLDGVPATGLNLLHGYSVKCHYSTADDQAIGRFVQHGPVLAIPEESGILTDGHKFFVIGSEPVISFNRYYKRTHQPGTEFRPSN